VRVAFNWGLARVKAVMDQRAAERSYGVPEPNLTPAVGWSLPALRRAWNQAKADVAPWWAECSKEAYNTGLDALARALRNWSDSRTGKRAGRPVGSPRFKSRRHSRPAVRFTTGTIRVEPDREHVTLPRDGLHKLTTRLATAYGIVVVEDLNVAGMLGNRRLARSIADAGFGEIRHERDARVVRIALTERGQALRAELPALLDGVAARALRGLTAAECAQLVALLRRVAGNLDVGPGASS
jgi:hypothetical protein